MLLAAGGAACRSASDVPAPPVSSDGARAVYVVEHGWHAGIAVRRRDLSTEQWAVLLDFPDARYLEVGWGDADYYQAADPGVGTLLKAGLWPTSSVLHVAAFDRPLVDVFPRREIIRIAASPDGLSALMQFIGDSHARDSTGHPVPLGPGLYGRSRFYKAAARYHVFNNCNTWTARALQRVGCSMAPARTFTVRSLLAQVRDCGTVIQEREEG